VVAVAPHYDATSDTADTAAQMLFTIFCAAATAVEPRKGSP
jgi:hypothetical protein